MIRWMIVVLAVASGASPVLGADANIGKDVFKAQCALCHSAEPNVRTGEYGDFLVGCITADGNAWGRPVGATVTLDGALLVSDDGANAIYRISHLR